VNVLTGEKKLIQENPGFAGFMADDDYRIRFAVAFTPDGGQQLMAPEESGEWKPYIAVTAEDAMTFGPAGFDKTGQTLYLMDSRNRDTSALFTLDLASNEQKLIAEDEQADVGGVLAHPTEKNIEAVSFTYDRRKWKVIDQRIADDLEFLRGVEPGEFEITSRTLDDKWWTVAYILDDGPVKYYLYDTEAKKAEYLFSNRSDLDQFDLVKMHSAVITTRDGLDMVSYFSLPPGTDTDGDGRPDRPQPMVLSVHGGPWGRDSWGFDPEHQWMANRGYAVLSVNFRGSTGFGKNFTNAANGEWSGKMHDDLIDAVEWAVAQKIADPHRIAIMGGSYGGYATLVGLTFTPDRFACGVDIVGPSNLVTLLNNMPPYWMPIASMMKDRVGDWTSEGGREQLLKKSRGTRLREAGEPAFVLCGCGGVSCGPSRRAV
jgi:dipeptidyl aminopeptidase/acylaminoacyl peptidase